MKGHVAGALRWHDFPLALWRWLGQGAGNLARFQEAFAASLGVESRQLYLFGTGRSALHAFVASLDLGPQDEVLLPGYTCVVVPNVFMHLGLPVRYVDITPEGFNCDAEVLAAAISPRTRIVLVPHNFGLVMAGLRGLRERFPRVVFVEDVAHAWGSREGLAPAGSLGHAAFFSFEFSKCLTTGLGGALLVNDEAMRQRLEARRCPLNQPTLKAVARQVLTLAYHRLSMALPGTAQRLMQALLRAPARALGLVAKTPSGELSGASRPDYAAGLHPLSAALGLQQLGRAEAVWRLRQTQAERYDDLLAGSAVLQPVVRAPGDVLLRYPVRVAAQQRERVIRALTALDIVPGLWFDDVVHPKGSLRYGYQTGQCPNGEAAAEAVLNLPLGLHARLSPAQAAGLSALAGS